MPIFGGLIAVLFGTLYVASSQTGGWAHDVCYAVHGACRHPPWLIVLAGVGVCIGLLEMSCRSR